MSFGEQLIGINVVEDLKFDDGLNSCGNSSNFVLLSYLKMFKSIKAFEGVSPQDLNDLAMCCLLVFKKITKDKRYLALLEGK